MDYLFNRNFLLLLTVGVIINTRVQGTLIKPTVPEKVEAFIGSDITISCNVHRAIKGLKVTWYFNNISVVYKDTKFQFNSSEGSSHYQEIKERNSSYLTIRNVTFNDIGWYFCEVTQDIPQLITVNSSETELIVYFTDRNLENNTTISTTICDSPTESNLEDNTTNSTICDSPTESNSGDSTENSDSQNASRLWLWIALAAGCTLTVTTVIITAVICRRKKEAPIYENTKEASKKHWKEDRSLQHCMPSKGYSNKHMDTLKPHDYECRPKESPVYENTKEASRSYGKKD